MPLQPMAASTPDKSIKQETTVNVEQLGSQLAPISQLIQNVNTLPIVRPLNVIPPSVGQFTPVSVKDASNIPHTFVQKDHNNIPQTFI